MDGVKKVTTWKGNLKGLTFDKGKLVDADGEILDLMDILSQFYSDKTFDISMSAKEEEMIDYEEVLEI